MKNKKKWIIIINFALLFFILNIPTVYGLYSFKKFKYCVPEMIANILKIIQIAEYVVPIVFFASKIIINKLKNNKKNTIKNIIIYLVLSIVLFLALVGLGFLIFYNSYQINDGSYNSGKNDPIDFNGRFFYIK